MMPKAHNYKTKAKINKLGLYQTKYLLHNNHQNKDTTYRMGENICKPYIRYMGLTSTKYKELIKFNSQKTNNPFLKMDK